MRILNTYKMGILWTSTARKCFHCTSTPSLQWVGGVEGRLSVCEGCIYCVLCNEYLCSCDMYLFSCIFCPGPARWTSHVASLPIIVLLLYHLLILWWLLLRPLFWSFSSSSSESVSDSSSDSLTDSLSDSSPDPLPDWVLSASSSSLSPTLLSSSFPSSMSSTCPSSSFSSFLSSSHLLPIFSPLPSQVSAVCCSRYRFPMPHDAKHDSKSTGKRLSRGPNLHSFLPGAKHQSSDLGLVFWLRSSSDVSCQSSSQMVQRSSKPAASKADVVSPFAAVLTQTSSAFVYFFFFLFFCPSTATPIVCTFAK